MRTLQWGLIVIWVLGIACGHTGSREEPIPDDAIGLSKAGIRDTPTPDLVAQNTSGPGERALLARAFPDAPPLIPHGIADFLPITRDQNSCIDCHETKEKVAGEATPIPRSHYIDLRNTPDAAQESVVGARFVCRTCHVSQTEAQMLVGNEFAKEE